MSVDRNSGVPLYRQVQDYIRTQIEEGVWRVGEQIPTEQMLCEQFVVSRITVTQALNRLASEGLLTKEQGRGTFVATPTPATQPLTLLSFSEEMRKRGLVPGSKILQAYTTVATARLQERLRLTARDQVFVFERLLTADGVVMGLQTSHLPCRFFPDLLHYMRDGVSLYQTLLTHYQVEVEQALETYSSILLSESEASRLGVPPAMPAFSVERLTFAAGEPMEFVQSLMRSDQYHFTVQLIRQVSHSLSS